MVDKNKALRMALEALESLQGGCTDSDDGTVEAITVWCPEVITAIREALTQTEQEPVAWVNLNELSEQIKRVNCGTVYGQPPEAVRFGWQSVYGQPPEAQGSQPLYTTPPQRKPLTDWEISNVYFDATGQGLRLQDKALAHKFARAIEAAHGIKE